MYARVLCLAFNYLNYLGLTLILEEFRTGREVTVTFFILKSMN